MTHTSSFTTDSDHTVRGKRSHTCIKAALAIALCIVLIFALQRLLVPKYMTSLYEGAMIGEYYESEHDNQVLFIGDCEVYENYSPITLWKEYGITSYIRGGPQQLIWQSYYLLEDTLRYSKPKVVVYNVLAMKYGRPQNEAYNRLNIDGMRLSGSKLGAIKASMLPEETMMSYIFPILRYHDRWDELTDEDIYYYAHRDYVTFNGYLMNCGTKPIGKMPTPEKLKDYSFGDTSYEYLDKIRELCAREGITLILVKAPTVFPYWYAEWDDAISKYADRYGLTYINFLDLFEETGIDLTTDTYDAGLHLNRAGAEKLSVYFGKTLQKDFGLEDQRNDERKAGVWGRLADEYYAMAEAQMNDIKEFGEVRTFAYSR